MAMVVLFSQPNKINEFMHTSQKSNQPSLLHVPFVNCLMWKQHTCEVLTMTIPKDGHFKVTLSYTW